MLNGLTVEVRKIPYSLNIKKFKIAQNAIEEKAKIQAHFWYKNSLKFSSLP
jgi:carboxyl-terminal processing protease